VTSKTLKSIAYSLNTCSGHTREVETIDQNFDDEMTHRTVINHLGDNEGGIVAVAGFLAAG